ncbi:superoxide dismutase [Pusillimonas sp. ANT_WB101]|uniref:superoxide dismutase n=1 Tax=Pusillimonas sp. ANT_WB101 TaxID=2597356 RepID=UPI0011EE7F3D|nr:superoxide dismutase [Pusillimonas sp. ANT_WB101]KAA0889946.1 superoxide dismutase [Pusillimonas sp. ANT_WB101]
MAYSLLPLPYAYDALEPHIDTKTMQIHHSRHHQAYVDNLNAALERAGVAADEPVESLVMRLDSLPQPVRTAVRNHGGGHANHSMFWSVMAPNGERAPRGRLAQAIQNALGGEDRFREAFTQAALSRFGSGWAWLSVTSGGTLIVEDTANQDSPLMHGNTPILGLDVWEHAYYLKYQNRRHEYVSAFYKVINWLEVENRFEVAIA